MDPPPAPRSRIVEFCGDAPAPTVVVAHVRAGPEDAHPRIDVERVYGPDAPLTAMPARFAGAVEDETLLVSLAHDGKVLGTAWPVFRGQVSLELGIPDMKEEEAAALLRSPACAKDLRAFRDRGVRPPAVEPTSSRGCAHCGVARAPVVDVAADAALAIGVALVTARFFRAAARSRPRPPTPASGTAKPRRRS